MKKDKKQIHLNGKLLRPLVIGQGAIFHSVGWYITRPAL